MWLDKEDLENIAVEYKTAETTIVDKVNRVPSGLLEPRAERGLGRIEGAFFGRRGERGRYIVGGDHGRWRESRARAKGAPWDTKVPCPRQDTL